MGREGEERGTLQAKTDAGHTSVSTETGHFPFHHVPGAPPSWLIKHNCNCEMPPLLTAARTGWQSLILPTGMWQCPRPAPPWLQSKSGACGCCLCGPRAQCKQPPGTESGTPSLDPSLKGQPLSSGHPPAFFWRTG